MTGSGIYQRQIASLEADHIMRRVYDGLPWIADVFVGARTFGARLDMAQWCLERWGEQAWPYGDEPRSGRWFTGSARIHGWEWWAFATEEDMNAFLEQFPQEETGP